MYFGIASVFERWETCVFLSLFFTLVLSFKIVVFESIDSVVVEGTKLGIASSVRRRITKKKGTGEKEREDSTSRVHVCVCVCFVFFLSSSERREREETLKKTFWNGRHTHKEKLLVFLLLVSTIFLRAFFVCEEKWRGEFGYLGGPWRQGYILLFFLSPLPITPRLSLSLFLPLRFLSSQSSLARSLRYEEEEEEKEEGKKREKREKWYKREIERQQEAPFLSLCLSTILCVV